MHYFGKIRGIQFRKVWNSYPSTKSSSRLCLSNSHHSCHHQFSSSAITRSNVLSKKFSFIIRTNIPIVGLGFLLSTNVAECSNDANKNENDKSDPKSLDSDPISRLIDTYAPHIGQITFGGVLGFCCGYAVKELGKTAAITVGVVFVLAQFAASKGYIQINWNKVKRDAISTVDPDGDGKLTSNDIKLYWRKFQSLMQFNLPSSGGFAGGFLFGVCFS